MCFLPCCPHAVFLVGLVSEQQAIFDRGVVVFLSLVVSYLGRSCALSTTFFPPVMMLGQSLFLCLMFVCLCVRVSVAVLSCLFGSVVECRTTATVQSCDQYNTILLLDDLPTHCIQSQ